MSKILTVYYSRKGENYFPDGIKSVAKGNTAYAAEHIQAAIGGDLFEIDTVKPYAENYRECCMEAVAEMKENARPEIQGYVDDLSAYDTLFVCFPSWCGTAPMCVFTFLEHYDLTGKRIAPLCTNEGSGMGGSERDIKRVCHGAEVKKGLSITGSQAANSKSSVQKWLSANGLM